mgnify:CR=1 FL=1
MTMTPATIHAARGARKKSKRVGRGAGSGRGTYSGRGIKGQKARTGGRHKVSFLGLKQSLQKIPKIRGFRSLSAKKETVNLRTLERIAVSGDTVTPAYLKAKGAVHYTDRGVKIVGYGTLTKKLTIEECVASKTALAAIEKAGGTIVF